METKNYTTQDLRQYKLLQPGGSNSEQGGGGGGGNGGDN